MILQLKHNKFVNLEAFQFGMGIFETMLVKNGVALDYDVHLDRLNRSLAYFGVRGHVEAGDVQALMSQRVQNVSGSEDDCYVVKLIAYLEGEDAYLDVVEKNYPYTTEKLNGCFKIALSGAVQTTTNELNSHKTTNYFERLRLLREANRQGFDEVVRLNEFQQVAEGTKTNIFIKKDGRWFTPSLESGILPGIAREYFIGIMKQQGIPIIETVITKEELHTADKIALSNSLIGLVEATLTDLKGADTEIGQLRNTYFGRIK